MSLFPHVPPRKIVVPNWPSPEHGDHEVKVSQADLIDVMAIAVGVRCRKCGWFIRAQVGLKFIQNDKNVLQRAIDGCLRSFKDQVPESCREAADLAAVMEVHRS